MEKRPCRKLAASSAARLLLLSWKICDVAEQLVKICGRLSDRIIAIERKGGTVQEIRDRILEPLL